jgi:hypothetical protein
MMEKFDTWEAAGFSDGFPGDTRKYNWEELTDGTIWEAIQHEDFTCTIQSFRFQLRTQALSRHLKVHIEIRDKAVRFQFYKEC